MLLELSYNQDKPTNTWGKKVNNKQKNVNFTKRELKRKAVFDF